MNRVLLMVTAMLALLFGALTIASYPNLPPVVPAHFGPNGADRFEPRSLQTWLRLPLIAIALCAFNYLIGAFLYDKPQLMNIPRKARLLALPPERRRVVMGWWWVLIQTIGLSEILLLGIAQFGLYRGAVGGEFAGRTVGIGVVLVAVGLIPVTLYFVWRMSEEVERQERGE